jgi:type III pantothenate kinase
MNLVVDIGNSRLKWSHVDNGPWRAGQSVLLQDDLGALLGQIWRDAPLPETIVVSNVSGTRVAERVQQWTMSNWGLEPEFFQSAARFKTIINEYKNPEQLGCDRWAAIIGARSLVAGDLCVVDCGTATTIDVLTGEDRFVGGIIFPGVNLIRDSLLSGTVDINEYRANLEEVLGRTTAECVTAGSLFGAAGGIDRILNEMAAMLDQPQLYITGGGARILIPLLDHSPQHDPDLVLIGLAQTLN